MISLGDMPPAASSSPAHLAADLRTNYAHYQPADNSSFYAAMRYEFDQMLFRIEDGVFLRLREPPELLQEGDEVEVREWGLRVPLADLDRLDAAIVRHFLRLLGKAERQDLSDDEQTAWNHIVDSIDYQRLCADRARPAYAEGMVRTIRADGAVYVEWHDGQREWLSPRNAGAVAWLTPGDAFGAFVRRDHRGRTIRMEGGDLLGRSP